MKAISINTARVIGNQSEAQRLAILAIDDEYRYNVTTWGKTRSDCRAMRRWAESAKAKKVLGDMADSPSFAREAGGVVTVANVPDLVSDIGCDPTKLQPVSTLEITELKFCLPLIDERTIYDVVRAFINLRNEPPQTQVRPEQFEGESR